MSQDLAGPIGLFVKFSTLQEYGVDRVFLLENANVDSSQRNVVFLVHAEKPRQVRTVAGMSQLAWLHRVYTFNALHRTLLMSCQMGQTVDYADSLLLYVVSRVP